MLLKAEWYLELSQASTMELFCKLYVCIYIYVCMHVCMYVCMYVCMHLIEIAETKLTKVEV